MDRRADTPTDREGCVAPVGAILVPAADGRFVDKPRTREFGRPQVRPYRVEPDQCRRLDAPS